MHLRLALLLVALVGCARSEPIDARTATTGGAAGTTAGSASSAASGTATGAASGSASTQGSGSGSVGGSGSGSTSASTGGTSGGPGCQPEGGACAGQGDCCSGINLFCMTGVCCNSFSSQCTDTSQCGRGQHCVCQICCPWTLSACNPNDITPCCAGRLCQADPTGGFVCRARTGLPCGADAECSSQHCAAGLCACVGQAAPCQVNADCCSGFCEASGTCAGIH